MTPTSALPLVTMLLLSATVLMCNGGTQDTVIEQPSPDGGVAADAGTDSIWETSPYKQADPEHPYQACAKTAVAKGDAPAISNFDGPKLQLLEQEGRDGPGFYSSTDGSDGSLTVELQSGALHVVSESWSVWGSGLGVVIGPALSDTEHCYYDASRYAGVRFRAKGSGNFRFNVGSFANYPLALGGSCDKPGDNCLDWPGATGTLTQEWQLYEFPFCALKAAGWSGATSTVDSTQLIDLFFLLPNGNTKELWLDDLEFFTKEAANSAVDCSLDSCPMATVPLPESVRPEDSWLPLTAELNLHNFDQETTHCGPIRRRYLTFVPQSLGQATTAPVFIGLPGTGSDAESFRNFLTQGRLDELATRDGAVIVYANAAPGPYSSDNPQWQNADTWRTHERDDGEVDDVAYFEMLLEDLQQRGVIAGGNDVYLLGLSNGGGMVLQLAKQLPERFKGIAPFMAYEGWSPTPVPPLTCSGLSRILFGISSEDPGLPNGYGDVLSTLPAEWAAATGLPQAVIDSPRVTALPDPVNEGADYTGSNAIALRTRNSHVIQTDMSAPDACAKVRVLEFVGGGHLWPTPELGQKANYVEVYGFPNQDLDASDAVWDFFLAAQ